MTAKNQRDGKGHRAYRRLQAALKRRTANQNLPCWLCGQFIDTTLPAGHRMSFSADHVQALATGGDLVKNELRPSHLSCNASRGIGSTADIWGAT
ncbi:hypothetical protein NCPPB3778_77 [Rathayibacter phage NCPPB3778]|nr:hypothetical protein NCPPB3778_77 [Rathayibacter phage NCPPB3778]